MTIYFNPRYDSSVFLIAADCCLGKAYSGKEALLSELELRAGLTCASVEHADRIIEYMQAMKAALDKASAAGKKLFYADSFERDDFGTAELMLGWRDALVKIGWDGKDVGSSEKIDVLSQIESSFKCPGSADRWRALLAEAARRQILRPTDRIMVQCAKDDLEPVLSRLFDSINAQYAVPVVEYHSKALPVSKEDQGLAAKCRILEFDNEYTAHEWIASQNLGQDDVVAEADEALLGDMLHTLGKPGIGAADEGIGAVMRLLPLGIALFKYPADINCLQSYLQSPRTPLGKLHTKDAKSDGTPVYPGAVRQLFDHICSEGGFGEKWDRILEYARFAWDGTPLEDKDYRSALEFIGMWDRSKDLPEGEARVSDVRAFIKGLNNWAGGCIQPECELNAQFQALQSNCGAMLRLLEGCSGETVSVEKLSRWASHICVPINISSDYARLGSLNVVSNVADIFSDAERLVWFAASTDNNISYEYDFLSRSEVSALRTAGALIPDKEQMARLEKAYKLEGLSRCASATIVTCRRISGVETVQSALLSELARCVNATEGTPVAKTASGVVDTDLGKKDVHTFDPAILKGFKRKAESYSSINTLLTSPVDYLLDYVKGYRQYGIEEVADLLTTEGTVAHAYIETLGEECGYNAGKMLTQHRSSFDAILDRVISENGLLLCLEENSLEEKSFRVGLKKSVETLLGIIIGNGLEIEGFEYEITAKLPDFGGPVYAKIDCLLKDPSDGKAVIIDFKYNSGLTYSRKIADNRELQLAIYRKVIETGGFREDADGNITNIPARDVKFIGYYAIPRKTLFTPENTLSANPAVEEVEQAPLDIYTMAARGYDYRWAQLRNGILEEGEGLPLDSLDYNSQPGLYPLEADYDNANLKARAYGDKNIVLKGGLN